MFIDISWEAMIGLVTWFFLVNYLKLGGPLQLDEYTQTEHIIKQLADWFCQCCNENDVEDEYHFWFCKITDF